MDWDRLNRLEREVALVARQIAGMSVRSAEGGDGGGSGGKKAHVILTDACPARIDDETPGTTTEYDIVKQGDLTGTPPLENWSLKVLPSGTHCGVTEIDGGWEIWPAYC